jgi:hypothetical protein
MLELIDWRQSGCSRNHLAFDYISTLMTRQEFDLIHILTPAHLTGPPSGNTAPHMSHKDAPSSTPSSSSLPVLSSAPILSPSASSASLLNIERPPQSHLSQFEHIRVFQHYRAVLGRTMMAVLELLHQCNTELKQGTADIRKMRVKMATNPSSVMATASSSSSRSSNDKASSSTSTPPNVATAPASSASTSASAAAVAATTSLSPLAAAAKDDDDFLSDDMEMLVVVPPTDASVAAGMINSGQSSTVTTAGAPATTTTSSNGDESSTGHIKKVRKPMSEAERTSFEQQTHISQCMEPQLATFVTRVLALYVLTP